MTEQDQFDFEAEFNKLGGSVTVLPSADESWDKFWNEMPSPLPPVTIGQFVLIKKIADYLHIVGMTVKVNEINTNGMIVFGVHRVNRQDVEIVPDPTDGVPRIGMNVRIQKYLNIQNEPQKLALMMKSYGSNAGWGGSNAGWGGIDPEWCETMDNEGVEFKVGIIETINASGKARIGRWWHSVPWLVPTQDTVAPFRQVDKKFLEKLVGLSGTVGIPSKEPEVSDSNFVLDKIKDDTWKCQDGRRIKVSEMEDSHLYNTIKFIDRKYRESGAYPAIYFLMTAEAIKRGMPLSGVTRL